MSKQRVVAVYLCKSIEPLDDNGKPWLNFYSWEYADGTGNCTYEGLEGAHASVYDPPGTLFEDVLTSDEAYYEHTRVELESVPGWVRDLM